MTWCFYLSLMAVAEPWPTVVMAVGRGRRRTVADRGRGRGSWPSPDRGQPHAVAVNCTIVYSCGVRIYSCGTRIYSCRTRMYPCGTRIYSCGTRIHSCGARVYSWVTRIYARSHLLSPVFSNRLARVKTASSQLQGLLADRCAANKQRCPHKPLFPNAKLKCAMATAVRTIGVVVCTLPSWATGIV